MRTRGKLLATSGASLISGALFNRPAPAALLAKPLGVQLYAVNAELKTDFTATLESIAHAGYRPLEFAGFLGHSAAEIRSVTDPLGLRCVGAHQAAAELESATCAHFNDEALRYAEGDLRELYFYPAQRQGHTEKTYRPGE